MQISLARVTASRKTSELAPPVATRLSAAMIAPVKPASAAENERALAYLGNRLESLSPREREFVIQVARGGLSKQIADDLGITEATAVHRSRAMRKMNARSLPELGRMADKLKLVPKEPQRF